MLGVKVIRDSGRGSVGSVVAGIDFVRSMKRANPKQQMVINLSVGSGLSTTMNEAVQAAFDAGIITVTSAGNSNVDACSRSPAAEATALTVGATGIDDSRATYSNYGSCVDLFAPGNLMTSIGLDNRETRKSGTSVASPYVAGLVALYLEKYPNWSATQIRNQVLQDASPVVRQAGRGSPNRLASSVALNGQDDNEDEDEGTCQPLFSSCNTMTNDNCCNRCNRGMCWLW